MLVALKMKHCVTITINVFRSIAVGRKTFFFLFHLTCHRWIIEYLIEHRVHFSVVSLQTLKFRFSYHGNRPARHRSNSKHISHTEPCRSTSRRRISLVTAHRLNIDHFYMGCWVERTFRKRRIIGATALRVQVRTAAFRSTPPKVLRQYIHFLLASFVSNPFLGAVEWKSETGRRQNDPSSDLAFSFNKMINDHFCLFLICPSSFLEAGRWMESKERGDVVFCSPLN